MTSKTKPLTQKILEHARELPEGAPLQTAGLLHLGNRPAVGRALSRLEKWGELFRIGHGMGASENSAPPNLESRFYLIYV